MHLHTHIQGHGFPILCLHGHPGSWQSMGIFISDLSTRFLTLTPDLRGYGKSQASQPFEMDAHLEDLEQLLNRHSIDQCLVLGWSLGGILAMELALRYPDRVKGLILIATAAAPRGNHPPITWLDNLNTGLASLFNWFIPGNSWIIESLGKKSLYRHLLRQHTSYAYRQLASAALPAYLRTSRHAREALNRAIRSGYNKLSAIKSLNQPCLLLCGQADCHIIPQASIETARTLPNCEVTCYPDVAHLFPWEIPDRVLRDLNQWLNRNFSTLAKLST